MNCANCKSRLFFSGDNEELFPGSELVFCYACKKKVTPFLEERNTFPTHAAHLSARRRELELGGVTPAGMSALTAYCAYLDRIAPRRKDVAANPPPIPAVPTTTATTPSAVETKPTDAETDEKMLTLAARVRLALWVAGVGGFAGIGSFITMLCILFGN